MKDIRINNPNLEVAIVAHRGHRAKYPENTLIAFEKSIEVGADFIEFDIHLTKDKQIVVIHDHSTKRTAVNDEDLNIENSTYDELKDIDVGKGENIPLLSQVMDLCKGKIGLQIEIKGSGMAKGVIKLLEDNDWNTDHVLISSFEHTEIGEITAITDKWSAATLEPTKATLIKGALSHNTFINEAIRLKAKAIHPHYKYAKKHLIDDAHEKSMLVNPWTVDSKKKWKKLIKLGVDAIITNDPEALKSFLDKRK